MTTSETFSIRPAGRHLLTIGRDLIQDEIAALVELVKNAFDADSPDVEIAFTALDKGKGIQIEVIDRGHGMSRDTVIGKWLVPSTDDKLQRKISPGGRPMQGRKGVGRYAASILGNDLLLETVSEKGEKTSLHVDWQIFSDAEYLDDVQVAVNSSDTDDPPNTRLTITGGQEQLLRWDSEFIEQLKQELKKLIPPVETIVASEEGIQTFEIILSFLGLGPSFKNKVVEKIEPFPIFDLFDYRISGQIKADGEGHFVYENQKARNTQVEEIAFSFGAPTVCGDLYIDIRVYDRDKSGIDQLIRRGLKNDRGEYLGKLEARNVLNKSNGVGVYRNGFRIRPLGDPDFDWLKLNSARVQNPSVRIGSNQVIGYVQVQSEEHSGLEEKSARDGLKESEPYRNLRKITRKVISELENRRFAYRRKEGLSRSSLKIERELEKMFSFDDVKKNVNATLTKMNVDKATTSKVLDLIAKEEKKKNRLAEDVRQAVAIYQGQATLGKIMNVVLHEARRPLNYFKSQVPNLGFWADQLKSEFKQDVLDEMLAIAAGVRRNSEIFVKLFGRLDPLAAGKRGKKSSFEIKAAIESAAKVFEEKLLSKKIVLDISGNDETLVTGYEQDIYVIFTNLIDNSVFWLLQPGSSRKKAINISISDSNGELQHIDYTDTGTGIEDGLLESNVIFEPEFSTKEGGQGLGLAIAGEAAVRNGLELKAMKSDSGAYFRIEPIEKVE